MGERGGDPDSHLLVLKCLTGCGDILICLTLKLGTGMPRDIPSVSLSAKHLLCFVL